MGNNKRGGRMENVRSIEHGGDGRKREMQDWLGGGSEEKEGEIDLEGEQKKERNAWLGRERKEKKGEGSKGGKCPHPTSFFWVST